MWRGSDLESNTKFTVFKVYIKHFSSNLQIVHDFLLPWKWKESLERNSLWQQRQKTKFPQINTVRWHSIMPALGAILQEYFIIVWLLMTFKVHDLLYWTSLSLEMASPIIVNLSLYTK